MIGLIHSFTPLPELFVFGIALFFLPHLLTGWYTKINCRQTGRNYLCRVCKYRWTELDPQPELIPHAIKFYDRMLAYNQADKNKKKLISPLNVRNIAAFYALNYLDQTERALKIMKMALQIANLTKIEKLRAYPMLALGSALIREGQPAPGVELVEQSIRIAKACQDWSTYALATVTLGDYALKQADYERAVLLFKECIYFKRKSEGFQAKDSLFGIQGLGEVALKKERADQALLLLSAIQSLRFARGIVLPHRKQLEFDTLVTQTRQPLDPQIAAQLWQQGAGMSLDDTIRYAWAIV